jgi:hypothetical protein
MRVSFPILVAASLAAVQLAAQQAPLVCPAPPAGRTCELYHYHVQAVRTDTKQRVEIFATPQFATQSACERARDARGAASAKVTEFIRAKQEKYEGERVGPCHCDMTGDRASAYFLNDAQRPMQLRTAEEIRLRTRERLLDMGLTTDSEVVRALDVDPPVTALLGTPKLVPPPQNIAVPIATSADDLRPTRTLETTKPTVAALDLPLIDIVSGTPASPPAGPEASPPRPPVGTPPVAVPPAPEAAPAPEPIVEQKVEAEVVPSEEETLSAQDTAERFVSYETQRIQNVIKASAAIADENLRSGIVDACMQRFNLLSNLRLLIEGSGMRGRLATAARDAVSESDRLALMAKLFGDTVSRHWAPKDARDIVFPIPDDIATAPDRILRDTSGRYTAEQKKNALYLVLATTQPGEDARLWLSTVVEEFLR